ncbi:hypothetical protein B0H14DRAFT_3055636 [Mycena olivaceomarginata]|nr:hypothetical protein B0H14DRAFT_3055636 [Mycena olivaceomarginata]
MSRRMKSARAPDSGPLLAVLDYVEDPEITDDYLPSKDLPFHYDPDNDPDLHKLEREEFTKDDDKENEEDEAADIMTGLTSDFKKMSMLQKLRTTVTKICSSPQRRKHFRTTAFRVYGDMLAPSGRKLTSLMPIRDVRHRWNHTHAMIKHGLMLRRVSHWDLGL